jgi:type I restriction enzyme S subunit
MELKKGYKQTELGIIPNDWAILKLKELGEVKRGAGSQYTKYADESSGIRFIRINDFFENNAVFVRNTSDIMRFAIDEDDILFAGTGNSAGASFIPKSEWIGLPHSYNAPRIRVNQRTSKEFLVLTLQSGYLLKQQKSSFVGAAQPFLDTKAIANFDIILPANKSEQTAIATALSDMDALISNLEKLIEKKKAIKQGVMQELLKPKEGWEYRTYGEVFDFLSTATFSRADLSDTGNIGYVHYGDIHTKWDNFLDIKKADLPKITESQKGKYSLLADGDIVMADASEDYIGIGKSVEIRNIGDSKIISGLHTMVLRDHSRVFVDGFKGYIHEIGFVKEQFFNLATGMKVYGVSKNNLKTIRIPVPTREEQEEIARVLEDIRIEIWSLTSMENKYSLVKQAMMQELLTGKTRLI